MPDFNQVLTVLRDHGIDPPAHMKMAIDSIVETFQERTTEFENSRRITGIISDLADISTTATKLSGLLKTIHNQTFDAIFKPIWNITGQYF